MGAVLIMAGLYLLSALCLYMIDIFCLWELIVVAVGLFPLLSYAKTKPKLWNMYFIVKELGLLGRSLFITLCYPTASYVVYPISIKNQLVLQMAGLSAILELIVWCLIVLIVAYATSKSAIDKCDDITKIGKLRACRWMYNLTTSVTIVSVFTLLLYIMAYQLESYKWNMIMFMGCVLLFRVVYGLLYIGTCRDKIKKIELLEESQDKPVEEVVDLDKEDIVD